MNINNLSDVLVKYIEDNKIKYNINYKETIECLKDLILIIEDEYKENGLIGDEENDR